MACRRSASIADTIAPASRRSTGSRVGGVRPYPRRRCQPSCPPARSPRRGLTVRVLGMISGTSADAVEAVLVELTGAPPHLEQRVLAGRTVPLPLDLQRRIHAIAAKQGDVEAICLLDVELGRGLRAVGARPRSPTPAWAPDEVGLIGSHGQTVWHAVREDGSVAGTLQVGNAAVIAERTGITTVRDLRSRDIAAGGQGAPLVAYVDWLLFRHATRWSRGPEPGRHRQRRLAAAGRRARRRPSRSTPVPPTSSSTSS